MKNDKEVDYQGMALVFGIPLSIMMAIFFMTICMKEDPTVVSSF